MEGKQRRLLQQLRSKLVSKMHVQPFTIYSDAVIECLIQKKPTTLEELEQVKGFPKNGKRINGFGELVISIFNDVESIQSVDVVTEGKNVQVRSVKPLSAF